ncbi:hypothetical protein ABZ445_16335 [Streptomyces chartreusis]|uniref:hypothetical protein n=1 Tax=Streptomyces chartreusis TaxID=1969 RepID=UPI0033F7C4B5
MSLDAVPPWVVAALALCVIILVVIFGAVISLRITVRGTSEAARPAIIRATGDMLRSVLDAPFRRRRQ